MRTIHAVFTDNEFRKICKAKKKYNKEHNTSMTWHRFILLLARGISVKRK